MTSPVRQILTALIARQNLSGEETIELMAAMLEGRFEEPQIVAALVALRTKGETGQELAAAADYMRQRMVRLDSNRTGILDT